MKKTPIELAAIYCRVSQREVANPDHSLEGQRKLCEELAKKNGRKVVKAFFDTKHSEGNGLRELKALVKKNLVATVYAYDISRIARNIDDFSELLTFFKKHNVNLLTVAYSPEQKFAASMELIFNSYVGNLRQQRRMSRTR